MEPVMILSSSLCNFLQSLLGLDAVKDCVKQIQLCSIPLIPLEYVSLLAAMSKWMMRASQLVSSQLNIPRFNVQP